MAWHDIAPKIHKLPPSARDVAPFPPRTLWLLDNSLYDGHRDGIEVECLEKFRGVLVNLQACCARVKSRHLRHVVILSLALLLLQLERNTTDGPALDTLHQVGSEAGNLVTEALGGDYSNHKVEGSILRKWPKDTGTAGREGEREKGEHFNTEQDERGAGLVVQRLWPTRCPD